MFLSREIDIKLYKIYTKTYKCKMLYEIRSIKQIKFNKYATNLKMTISQRSLRNSGLLLFLFEFNNFLLFMRPEHVTRTPTNGSSVFLSRVPSVSRDDLYTELPLEGVLVT